MATKGALANLDEQDAIERLANGTMLKQIAAEYGVKKQSLWSKLSKHPDYKDAIASQADSMVQDCILEHWSLPEGAPMTDIARARAKADVAFKYAKAHNPAYADKVDASAVQINVVIARESDVLDCTPQIVNVAPQLLDNKSE